MPRNINAVLKAARSHCEQVINRMLIAGMMLPDGLAMHLTRLLMPD